MAYSKTKLKSSDDLDRATLAKYNFQNLAENLLVDIWSLVLNV
jgi:hypothetical protein